LHNPGWVPSEEDLDRVAAALDEARRGKRRADPGGTSDPSASTAPATDIGGAGQKRPPDPAGQVRLDGECDEDGNIGPTSPRARLPSAKTGTWQGEIGNSGWLSNNPEVIAITGGTPIPFVDGRPDFTRWSRLSINFEPGELTGYHGADVALTHAALAKSGNPDVEAAGSPAEYLKANGLTPHHATDTCIQLVPEALNRIVQHIGSAADIRYGRSLE
jgi:hypothetical protein